jgi:serine/threonine-protein phosphatase 2A activator
MIPAAGGGEGTDRPGTPWARAMALDPPAPEPEPGPGGYRTPSKAVSAPADVHRFVRSETYREIVSFATELQRAATSQPLPSEAGVDGAVPMSTACAQAVEMLGAMEGWVDEIPALPQGMRYGNLAFKQWHGRLVQELPVLLGILLPENLHPAIVELAPYLETSFGDPQRIDYGTGHEAAFAAWMLAMVKVAVFPPSDMPALALRLFPRYLRAMRRLQLVYKLEPAGSHGNLWSPGCCARLRVAFHSAHTARLHAAPQGFGVWMTTSSCPS